jgi:predicted acyl esterase
LWNYGGGEYCKFKLTKPKYMRKIFLLLLALLAIVQVQAQNSLDSAWIRDNYTKKEIYIPMRDGVKLFTLQKMQQKSIPF